MTTPTTLRAHSQHTPPSPACFRVIGPSLAGLQASLPLLAGSQSFPLLADFQSLSLLAGLRSLTFACWLPVVAFFLAG